MLASEQLAAFLGYGVNDIASSLELLLDAGLITRTSSSAHTARLYRLLDGGPGHGWLPRLLEFTSTRSGRLAMIAALRRRSAERGGGGGVASTTPELLVFDPAARHSGLPARKADGRRPRAEPAPAAAPQSAWRRPTNGERRRRAQ